jgi:hypothetical protein
MAVYLVTRLETHNILPYMHKCMHTFKAGLLDHDACSVEEVLEPRDEGLPVEHAVTLHAPHHTHRTANWHQVQLAAATDLLQRVLLPVVVTVEGPVRRHVIAGVLGGTPRAPGGATDRQKHTYIHAYAHTHKGKGGRKKGYCGLQNMATQI